MDRGFQKVDQRLEALEKTQSAMCKATLSLLLEKKLQTLPFPPENASNVSPRGYVRDGAARSKDDQKEFRKNLVEYYETNKCMVLGNRGTRPVVAAHIYPVASHKSLPDFNMHCKDIWDRRNGLLLLT
jgi:hypothetical protein